MTQEEIYTVVFNVRAMPQLGQLLISAVSSSSLFACKIVIQSFRMGGLFFFT